MYNHLIFPPIQRKKATAVLSISYQDQGGCIQKQFFSYEKDFQHNISLMIRIAQTKIFLFAQHDFLIWNRSTVSSIFPPEPIWWKNNLEEVAGWGKEYFSSRYYIPEAISELMLKYSKNILTERNLALLYPLMIATLVVHQCHHSNHFWKCAKQHIIDS